jgi:hypothetical protein
VKRGGKASKTAYRAQPGQETHVSGSSLHGASAGHLEPVRLLVREAPGAHAPPHAGLPGPRIFPCP